MSIFYTYNIAKGFINSKNKKVGSSPRLMVCKCSTKFVNIFSGALYSVLVA
jgi:hypothetical protein